MVLGLRFTLMSGLRRRSQRSKDMGASHRRTPASRMAPASAMHANVYKPASGTRMRVSAHVLTLGATKPPNAPAALMMAMPLAAPTPLRQRVGKVQKRGCTEIESAAVKHRAASATAGPVRAETARPTLESSRYQQQMAPLPSPKFASSCALPIDPPAVLGLCRRRPLRERGKLSRLQ